MLAGIVPGKSQQYAAPPVVRPQLPNPRLSAAQLRPPGSAAGAMLQSPGSSSAVPHRVEPPALRPQQYAPPSAVTPHADSSPAVTAVKIRPPDTATGIA